MARLLIEAILNGDVRLAHDLIQHGNYGCVDSQTSRRDGTALFFCCSRGQCQLAKLLIQSGASVNSQNKCWDTPLHAGADWGHADVVRLLLQEQAEVNAKNHRGDTPLHLAAYRGHLEVSQSLVEAGADLRALNSAQVTPQTEARGQGHCELGDYLRDMELAQHPEMDRNERSDNMIFLDPPKELPFRDPIPPSQSRFQSAPATLKTDLPTKKIQEENDELENFHHHHQNHHHHINNDPQHLEQQRQQQTHQHQKRRHSHCTHSYHVVSENSPVHTSPPDQHNMASISLDPLLQVKIPPQRLKPVESAWGCPPPHTHTQQCRRASSCSTGSCVSEFSGSESLSSDVSSGQPESLRDDIDVADQPSYRSIDPYTFLSCDQTSSLLSPPSISGRMKAAGRRVSVPSGGCVSIPAACTSDEFPSIFNSSQFSCSSLLSVTAPLRSLSTGYSSGFSSNDLDFASGSNLSSSSSGLSSYRSTGYDDVRRLQSYQPHNSTTTRHSLSFLQPQTKPNDVPISVQAHRPSNGALSAGTMENDFNRFIYFPPATSDFDKCIPQPEAQSRSMTSMNDNSNDLSSVSSHHSCIPSGLSMTCMNIPLN